MSRKPDPGDRYSFSRSDRVAGQLRRELGALIHSEVKDPAVGFVTVSDVEVSPDLRHARVFVTVYDTGRAGASIKALNRAAGFLRGRLARLLRSRSVPDLRFQHDDSVERAERIERLLDGGNG